MVPRKYRFVLRPGWLVLHVVIIVVATTMVLLGRWQLHVSESKHFSVQNFGYALQWWAFSLFTVVMWARLIRDATRRTTGTPGRADAELRELTEAPVAYRRYVMPQMSSTTVQPVDAEHAAYNRYLSELDARQNEESV